MNRRWIYLFPPGWRREYGPDLAETLAALPLSLANGVNLVDGAGDAWIDAFRALVLRRAHGPRRGGSYGAGQGPNRGRLALPPPAARHRGPVWAVAAASWSCILLLAVAVPPYQETVSGGPHEATRTVYRSLVAVKGPLFLVALGIPLVLSVACLLSARLALRRESWSASVAAWICVGLAWALWLVPNPNAGMLLLPVPVLLTVGTAGTSVWRVAERRLGRLGWGVGAVAWSSLALVGASVLPYHDTVVRWVIRGRGGIMTSAGTRVVPHTLVATKGALILLFPLGVALYLSLACFGAMWVAIRHDSRPARRAAWLGVGLTWVAAAVAISSVGWVLLPVPALLSLGLATRVSWPARITKLRGPGWALPAVAWACLLEIGVLVLPFNQVLSTSVSAGGPYVIRTGIATLFSVEGFYALLVFGVPLLLSVVCWVALRVANGRYLPWAFVAVWACVGLTWLQCLFGLSSVGWLLIPVALLLSVAASKAPRASTARAPAG